MSMRDAQGAPEPDDFLRRLVRRMPAFVWATDAELRITFIDGAALRHAKLDDDAIARIKGTHGEALLGTSSEEVLRLLQPLLEGQPVNAECHLSGRWYFITAEPHFDDAGTLLGTTGAGVDITHRHDAEERLKDERATLNQAQELADVGSFVVHIPSRTVVLSPQMRRTLGMPDSGKAVRFSELLSHIHPRDRRSFAQAQRSFADSRGTFQFDHRIVRENGEVRHVRYRAHIQRNEHGRAMRCIGTMQDITQLVEAAHLANHDPLTGLPNRTLLGDRLAQAVALAHREQLNCCVAFIDLDNFKNINDSLGHSEGDVLLLQVAQRLRELIRETDTLARIGGDEFVVVLNDAHADGVEAAIEKIRASLAAPFTLSGGPQTVTASIGLALYPHDADGSEELLRYADAAMYEAKHDGRNKTRRYRREQGSLLVRRMRIHADLRKALDQSQLQVLYQPLIGAKTLEPIGVEALVRWRHPELGLLQPAQFIPLTDDTDLGEELGGWVLRTALAQVAQWRREYGINVRLSVNVSARQLARKARFAQTLAAALQETQLTAEAIDVDVTENALMQDLQSSAAVLTDVRDQGVGISIDDFGTGRNSLSYLKQIPATGLKIDRSFVMEMDKDLFDQAISYSFAALGKTLGLRVAAEGVETLAQFRALIMAGCDELQGHFFSPAMPPEQFVEKYVPFVRTPPLN